MDPIKLFFYLFVDFFFISNKRKRKVSISSEKVYEEISISIFSNSSRSSVQGRNFSKDYILVGNRI